MVDKKLKMKQSILKISIGIMFSIFLISFSINLVNAESVPSWVKNNALWYGQGDITEIEFLNSIKFLIEQDILMRSMMSIPEVVREIVTRNRSIYDCMKMDLINYTALAVKIQPEIEKILGNSVNLNTVVVAIKRYADSFEIKEEMKEESVLKNARLLVTLENLSKIDIGSI